MPSFANRLSNIIYWIMILVNSGGIFVSSAWISSLYFQGYKDLHIDLSFLVILFSIVLSTAVWATAQYLLTGSVKIVNPRVVAAIFLTAAALGAAVGQRDAPKYGEEYQLQKKYAFNAN